MCKLIRYSDDDKNLAILLNANRVGRGKLGSRDIITMNIQYPPNSTFPIGTFIQLINGVITDGQPFSAVANSGRLKSKTYNFSFENKIGG